MKGECAVCKAPVLCVQETGPSYCPDHCPDHDYVYDPFDGHTCATCAAPPPRDFYIWPDE